LLRSQSRMASSISQSSSLIFFSSAANSDSFGVNGYDLICTDSSCDSSRLTLISLFASVMRSDLICSMAILSNNSPGATGTANAVSEAAGVTDDNLPAMRRRRASAISANTGSHAPSVFWRNTRIDGYQGLSERRRNHRQSDAVDIATHTGMPIE